MSYIVEHLTGNRIIVRGPLPVGEFAALTKAWEARGLDSVVPGIAGALGASLAVCAKDDVETWRTEVDAGAFKQADGDVELTWILGSDTGVSSKTIFSALSERYGAKARSRSLPDIPSDPSDFGRCFRLLEAIPAWRSRLGEVAAKYPKWQAMADAWDELEALWLEESPNMTCPKMYKRMQELRGR